MENTIRFLSGEQFPGQKRLENTLANERSPRNETQTL
jgi:hypothetical protein